MNPLTIVISTYKQDDHHLPLILHSLAVQSRKDFDVLVYNDGPSIATALACRPFEDSLNISFKSLPERKDDFGYSQREEALKIVETEFIYFTAGDNFLVPGAVEMFLGELQQKNLDFVYWDFLCRYPSANGNFSTRHLPWNVLEVTPQQNRIDISAFAVKTSKAREIGFPVKDRFADGAFVTQLMLTPDLKYAKIEAVLSVHC